MKIRHGLLMVCASLILGCGPTSEYSNGNNASQSAQVPTTPESPHEIVSNQDIVAPGEDIIGKWRDPNGWIYAIVKSNGKFFIEYRASASDITRHELKVINSSMGRKYVDTISPTGDYSVITSEGKLREYDRQGYIRTLPAVEELIGKWRDTPTDALFDIVNVNKTYYLDFRTLPSAEPERHKLQVKESATGREYFDSKSKTGDYYVIAQDGTLRGYDRQGYVRTFPSDQN